MSDEQISNLAGLVEETIRALYEKGTAAIDLAPLVKLLEAVKAHDAAQNAAHGAGAQSAGHPDAPVITDAPSGHIEREARRGEEEASEEVLARATAIIDVLVQGGDTPEHATQVMTRQLLAAGLQLPASGGDSRAWKRLFYWRNNLIHHKREGVAWDLYCRFKEELAHIPPEDRLRLAVGDRLWDQRNRDISEQNIA